MFVLGAGKPITREGEMEERNSLFDRFMPMR
jgi:hypothetical protein